MLQVAAPILWFGLVLSIKADVARVILLLVLRCYNVSHCDSILLVERRLYMQNTSPGA